MSGVAGGNTLYGIDLFPPITATLIPPRISWGGRLGIDPLTAIVPRTTSSEYLNQI